MTVQAECLLFFPGYTICLSNPLPCNSHVVAVIDVPKPSHR
jgi:hypothetical protein